ncbi:MAG: ribonuclease III domain-containing protein [Cyanobacteria bacterium P01_B01_bin.77]
MNSTGSGDATGVQLSAELSQAFSLEHLQSQSVQAVSPVSLAYIGDAVFELYVRMKFLWPLQRIQQFHQQVVSQVKAEQQADYLNQLMPHLDPAEADIVRRGRNATSKSPKRLSAKIYRQATAFETLVGYLYLTNQSRLLELLNRLAISPSP